MGVIREIRDAANDYTTSIGKLYNEQVVSGSLSPAEFFSPPWSTGVPKGAAHVASWLADDLAASYSDLATVTSWFDVDGLYELVPFGTGLQYIEAGDVHGLPAVKNGGSALLNYLGALSTSDVGSVIAVVVRATGQSGFGAAWAHNDHGATNRHLVGVSGNPSLHSIWQRDADTADSITGGASTNGVAYIHEWSSNGSAYELRINNAVQSLTVAGGANTGDWFESVTGPDSFSVMGARSSAGLVYAMKGQLSFLQVNDAQLSAGERTALYDYLSAKYSISI